MSVNKAIVMGHIGNDLELKYTNSGAAVLNISIATSDTWKDKNTGEKKTHTEWHSVVAWKKLAEVIAENFEKGSMIYIEGEMRTSRWEDGDGVMRYKSEIVAKKMSFCGTYKKDRSTAPAQYRPEGPGDEDIPF